MEVLPTPTYIIKALTYKEYNTLCACVAKCAGVKVRVDPTEANELNLSWSHRNMRISPSSSPLLPRDLKMPKPTCHHLQKNRPEQRHENQNAIRLTARRRHHVFR
jgi:hypothetical protein